MENEQDKSQGNERMDTLPDGSPAPNPKEESSKPPEGDEDPKGKEIKELQAKLDEKEREKKGVLNDLQGEREKRHFLEEENMQLKEREVKDVVDPLAGETDPEATVTIGTLQKLAAASKLQMEKQQQREDIYRRNQIWEKDKETAVKKYTVENEGEGLDFVTVSERGQRLLETKPYLKQAIINSDTPAEDLYELGLTHPDSKKLLKEQGGKEVIRKMAEKGKGPVTSSTSSGGGGGGGVWRGGKIDLSNLTADEAREIAFDPSVSADDILANLKQESEKGK